jgi:hypothetical protein
VGDFFPQIVAIAAALLRVATLKPRDFPWFMAYLAMAGTRGVLLWIFHYQPSQFNYSHIWAWSEPLLDLLWIAMALELYSKVADLYPGISRRKWALGALLLAAVITAGTIIEPHDEKLQQIFLLRRSSASVLAVAISFIAALFAFFRNNIPKNLVRHAAIMAVYFFTQAAPYYAVNVTGRIVDWGEVSIWCARVCYLAWAVLLTQKGQERPPLERQFSDQELEQARLQNLSETVRFAKSIGRKNTDD